MPPGLFLLKMSIHGKMLRPGWRMTLFPRHGEIQHIVSDLAMGLPTSGIPHPPAPGIPTEMRFFLRCVKTGQFCRALCWRRHAFNTSSIRPTCCGVRCRSFRWLSSWVLASKHRLYVKNIIIWNYLYCIIADDLREWQTVSGTTREQVTQKLGVYFSFGSGQTEAVDSAVCKIYFVSLSGFWYTRWIPHVAAVRPERTAGWNRALFRSGVVFRDKEAALQWNRWSV